MKRNLRAELSAARKEKAYGKNRDQNGKDQKHKRYSMVIEQIYCRQAAENKDILQIGINIILHVISRIYFYCVILATLTEFQMERSTESTSISLAFALEFKTIR